MTKHFLIKQFHVKWRGTKIPLIPLKSLVNLPQLCYCWNVVKVWRR